MNCTIKENMIKLEAYGIISLEHSVTGSRTRYKKLDKKKELISRYFSFMESEKLSDDPACCSVLEINKLF